MALFNYRIASGSGVVLASLTNIEDYFAQWVSPRPVGIASQPLNRFPIRELTADSVEIGYGSISQSWAIGVIPDEALTQFLADFCNSDGSGSQVTIYTRRHDLGDYGRYNANLAYPLPGDDYVYRSGQIVGLELRFTGLSILA